jgi:glycerol-3-phosphate dehydrogenase (NAD(P)+)
MLPSVNSAASVASVAVIGAGSWGTTIGAVLSANTPTTVWARDPAVADDIDVRHRNHAYLPGVDLPATLRATADLRAACTGAEAVVMAVPSHGFRAVLAEVADVVAPHVPVVSLSKGVERDTLLRMTEVVLDVLGDHDPARVATLTGPNLAREIAEGQPAASVVACADPATAAMLQQLFMTERFRVYTNPDVVGCEIAGATKNLIAIAVGTAAGLGYGDNTQAALITRGLAEVTRLGVALGGEPLTFAGLAGMGDLVATCTSTKSRNRSVGVQLGRGQSLDDIIASSNMVAEGVRSTSAVLALASRVAVEMPIAGIVGAVLHDGRRPSDLVADLMLREAKSELYGLRGR